MNSETPGLLADVSADIISVRGECVGVLVLYEVEPLFAVERELIIARQQRQPLGDGVGDDPSRRRR